ncbi:hypothetical protein EPO05_06105 [Patescibacteria group bacterium]|nr:MAG: hypothetical protein EPO05_06105 [Patescibacteria group bacterium]
MHSDQLLYEQMLAAGKIPRGGAPDPTPTNSPAPNATSPASGGGNTPSASPGAGAQPASSPPSTPEKFTTPADDWQSKYTELEGKYKAWDGFGEPATVKQTMDFARQVVTALQSGQSAVFDPETGKVLFKSVSTQNPAAPADPFDGIDELPPREMAARLRDIVRNELAGTVKQDVENVKKLINDALGNLGGQQKLFMTAARLAQQHPDVPFEELVAEATRMSSMTPEQLLEAALQQKLSPAQQQKIIEQKVQEALAARQQEQENEEAQLLAPKMSPFMSRMADREQAHKDGSLVERRQKSRLDQIRKIREIARKAS